MRTVLVRGFGAGALSSGAPTLRMEVAMGRRRSTESRILSSSDSADARDPAAPRDDLGVMQAVYAALLAFSRVAKARSRHPGRPPTMIPPCIIRHPASRVVSVERETHVALRTAKKFLSRTALFGGFGLLIGAGLIAGCSSSRSARAAAAPVAVEETRRDQLRQELAFLSTPSAAPTAPGAPAAPQKHTVQSGETLWRIAMRYGVHVDALQRANGIAKPSTLRVGQILIIPERNPVIAREPLAIATGQDPLSSAILARPAAPVGTGDGPFRWPVAGRVATDHGPAGIDIEAPEGDPVMAARAGTVSFVSDRLQGYGKTVVLAHPGGYQSFYAYNGDILVRTGDSVRQGDPIARVGKTGRTDRPMLHFRVFKDGSPVDAARLLR